MNREEGRKFLKHFDWDSLPDDFQTDQVKKIPNPPLEKPHDDNAKVMDLPEPSEAVLKNKDLFDLIKNRKSHRVFSSDEISLVDLSFLLWATQGVKSIMDNGYVAFRTVPSAGARHPFETYVYADKVNGLEKGLYRYLPFSNQMLQIKLGDFSDQVGMAAAGQIFVGKCAATFIWSVTPYRTEWRYDVGSYKPILLDAGHVCQNLYLACEALGLGTVAIAAYDQKKMDKFIEVDSVDEMTVYVAPVGWPKNV